GIHVCTIINLVKCIGDNYVPGTSVVNIHDSRVASRLKDGACRKKQGTWRDLPERRLHPEQIPSDLERPFHVRKKGSGETRHHDRWGTCRSWKNAAAEGQGGENVHQRRASPPENEQG